MRVEHQRGNQVYKMADCFCFFETTTKACDSIENSLRSLEVDFPKMYLRASGALISGHEETFIFISYRIKKYHLKYVLMSCEVDKRKSINTLV